MIVCISRTLSLAMLLLFLTFQIPASTCERMMTPTWEGNTRRLKEGDFTNTIPSLHHRELMHLRGGFARKQWQKKSQPLQADKNATSAGQGYNDGGNSAMGTNNPSSNNNGFYGSMGSGSVNNGISPTYNSTGTGASLPQQQQQQQNVGIVKGFWLSTRFMERFFKRFLSLFFVDPDILRIVSKICATIFWAYLALSALGTIGFDTKPLLSLLSISGLTFGFAAKDILTNLFAGIFIIFTRPFKRGQIISVNNMRGKVMSIDVRYCKLQSLKDKSEMLVPLSVVYSNTITIENPTTK